MILDRFSQASAVFAAAIVLAVHPGAGGPGGQDHDDGGTGTVQQGGLPLGWTMTSTGPLNPADRDILVRVRLAGLWEMPAGEQAAKKGVSGKVREIAPKIAAEHHVLDEQVRAAAAALGVTLPDAPTATQQGWLAEMSAAQGQEFDLIFVDRLRQAHGEILPLISEVRAGTRNSAVRAFAEEAHTAVMRHMGYLESTGLVDFNRLAVPPAPPGPVAARNGLSHVGGVHPLLIWLVLLAAAATATTTTMRVLHAR